jgi:hypothetical protein
MQNEERRYPEWIATAWMWILRGIAMASLWACYRTYDLHSLGIPIGLVALGLFEIRQEIRCLRATFGTRTSDRVR